MFSYLVSVQNNILEKKVPYLQQYKELKIFKLIAILKTKKLNINKLKL